LGGNSLLLFANRASNIFKKKERNTLLPHENKVDVKEAIIVLDTGGFPYPNHNQYPLFLLLSQEREDYQRKSGAYDEMIKIGHKVRYYKGSKHISFMDHGYVNPINPVNPNEPYFNGTLEDRKAFFDQIRQDIRNFLKESGDMRNELFEHYQKLSFNFYDEHRTGQLMTRISNDSFDLAELYHHGPEDNESERAV